MIFLRTPNLIFLKSKKTAGTSVEVALSCNATADDIVTPLVLPDEVIRLETGGRPATNWADDPADEVRFNQLAAKVLERKRAGLPVDEQKADKAGARFFNHMTPDLIVERLGRDTYVAALKVTICRHPYDQVCLARVLATEAQADARGSGRAQPRDRRHADPAGGECALLLVRGRAGGGCGAAIRAPDG